MKYVLKCLIFGVLFSFETPLANGQATKQISLSEVFGKLGNTNVSLDRSIRFSDHLGFDFRKLTPLDTAESQTDRFRVGYDPDGKIAEITWFKGADGTEMPMRFYVFEFQDFRILMPRTTNQDIGVIIVCLKNSGNLFLINCIPYFKDSPKIWQPRGSWSVKCEEVSMIAKLDEYLFPHTIFRIRENKIFAVSDVKYEIISKLSKIAIEEKLNMALNPSNMHNISDSTIIDSINLSESYLNERYFFVLTAQPYMPSRLRQFPIWTNLGLPILK